MASLIQKATIVLHADIVGQTGRENQGVQERPHKLCRSRLSGDEESLHRLTNLHPQNTGFNQALDEVWTMMRDAVGWTIAGLSAIAGVFYAGWQMARRPAKFCERSIVSLDEQYYNSSCQRKKICQIFCDCMHIEPLNHKLYDFPRM